MRYELKSIKINIYQRRNYLIYQKKAWGFWILVRVAMWLKSTTTSRLGIQKMFLILLVTENYCIMNLNSKATKQQSSITKLEHWRKLDKCYFVTIWHLFLPPLHKRSYKISFYDNDFSNGIRILISIKVNPFHPRVAFHFC